MTAEAYARDVAAVARAVGPLLEHAPERQTPPTVGVFLIEMHVRASRIAVLTAAQQALQLAFDAATVAVLHPEAAGDPEAVSELLDNPDLVLNMVWAGPGSLRQVFTVDPLTADGRENILYIFSAGFLALAFIPGGQPFAVAYAFTLGTLLQVGRWRERYETLHPVRVRTIDKASLEESGTEIRIYPPGTSWHPPDSTKPGQHEAELFATLRDRVDKLEAQAQHDRATIRRLEITVASLRAKPSRPE
ncbi:hypothetical protein [uncultured Leifsonia sp.]|uniref:hypothetical protein n=1 Tax=uncultured Leifsonia sp. TaxID=340359 RepID=UPI0025D02788|nr:hypothetical protein [uncultured Leifsonia sp.]